MRILLLLVIVAFVVAGLNRLDTQDPEPGPVASTEDSAGIRSCGPIRKSDQRVDCVRWLQNILRGRGAAIQSTGSYKDLTIEAVQQFQRARDLSQQDGAVDEATLHALLELPSENADWDLRRECVSLRRNNSGTDAKGRADSKGRCVIALRERLNEHGAELPDGDRFDEATEVAVRAFQISAGLEAGGIVGPRTKDALYGPRLPGGEPTINPNCEPSGCAMYLTRRMTHGLAGASRDDPARYAVISALTVLACRRVKALALDVVCQTLVSYFVDTVIDVTAVADKAQQASKRNACLVVNLGYPRNSSASWSPISLGVNSGPNCHY